MSKYKVLFISDMHKRHADSANIKGQIAALKAVQNDIYNFVKENEVTHIVTLGDWYHRGFHRLSDVYGAMQDDIKLSKAVNGNVYHTIGNHFYLERDQNPEMYIIQPNPYVKPIGDITLPEKPIFHCQPYLDLECPKGTVRINFFHFSKTDKNYHADRPDNVIYNVGVYHDDTMIPGWIREREGYLSAPTNSSYIDAIFDNIDLAVCGHIHVAIGTITDSRIPMIIPGALSVTQNKEQFKHMAVELPMLTIDDDGVSLSMHEFKTHLEMMSFKEKAKQELMPSEVNNSAAISMETITGLNSYMQARNYSDKALEIVKVAQSGITLPDVISILYKKTEPDEIDGLI